MAHDNEIIDIACRTLDTSYKQVSHVWVGPKRALHMTLSLIVGSKARIEHEYIITGVTGVKPGYKYCMLRRHVGDYTSTPLKEAFEAFAYARVKQGLWQTESAISGSS